MNRTKLLMGISSIAFAASAAGVSAQTTTTDEANNRRTIDCVRANPENYCEINNSVTFDPRSSFNSATVSAQGGGGNDLRIQQRGNNNVASSQANGSYNNTFIEQGEDTRSNNLSSRIEITGSNNRARVRQAAGENVIDGGNNSSLAIIQAGNGSGAGGDYVNDGFIAQSLRGNSATLTQVFTSGASITAGANVGFITQGGNNNVQGGANDGIAVLSQSGTNLRGSIAQSDSAFTGLASDDNRAFVRQTGAGSSASIEQRSRANTATVTLGGGGLNDGTGNRVNVASVIQLNQRVAANADGSFTDTADNATIGRTRSNNSVNTAIIGIQNLGTVYQDGVNNSVTLSILGGGPGNTGSSPAGGFPADRPEGNSAEVQQYGRGNLVGVSAGGRTSANPDGARGNSATVVQGSSDAASDTTNARDMKAAVYQLGTGDTVAITQLNLAATIAGATVVQSGSSIDVAQLSRGSSATVRQNGSNSATITQGLNADNSGGFGIVELVQADRGSVARPPSSGDPFNPDPGGTIEAINSAAIVQYGIGNAVFVEQDTINGSATVFQSRLSVGNEASIAQGTGSASMEATGRGGNSTNLSASINQAAVGSSAEIAQDFNNNTASIVQSSSSDAFGSVAQVFQGSNFNSASVTQTGSALRAVVSQYAPAGTSANPNLVSITQTGVAQDARIEQLETAGASVAGDVASGPAGGSSSFPNARPGGAASAEAVITQSVSNNSAFIVQLGRGQYARIEQAGSDNVARIRQNGSATNSVAIIEQNGNNNSYFITQDNAGAYIRVQQSGNNNAATARTTFGSPSTGSTTAP